jgi:hypothetical protein
MSLKKKLLVALGLVVLAVLALYTSIRWMSTSPYPEIAPERAKQLRARIEEARRQGPPRF